MLNFGNKTWVRPGDVKEGDAFAVKVVAVARGAGYWACYQGPSDWPDQRVAEQGDPVPAEAASKLFYVMCLRQMVD